jgi:predicted metal-binding membrane protein
MTSPSAPLSATIARRDRVIILASIVLITALAWAYLIYLDREMSASADYSKQMAAMGMSTDQPWNAASAFFNFAMWTIMMIGMMAGSAAPMLLLIAGAHAGRGERRVPLAALCFGLGYFVVWTGFSAVATLAQGALHQFALLSPAMKTSSPRLGGFILLAAGVYQLTPWKAACLAHCHSPIGFLMTHSRGGNFGAIRMGIAHGTYCLGCCWALMCVLFAVGVMNLIWVAALTLVVLVEKISPASALIARIAGICIIAYGIVLMAAWH